MSESLPPRKLETPTRKVLLAHYAATENASKALLTIEVLVGIGALVWLIPRVPHLEERWWILAFVLGSLVVFRWFLAHVFLNKIRVENIRPDAKFGVHTRDSLVAIANEVFARLKLRRGSVPVFLIRSKDVNAHAVRCELWPGMHLFNGVFLNRSILHLLDERELACVIGHELGHVIPYSPLLSRCYAVHSLVTGVASAALAAAFPHPGVAMIAPFALAWILDWVVAFPHLRLSRGMEFLCDDYGAQSGGLLPAISGEVKIAFENEARQRLLLRVLKARADGMELSPAEIADAYEEAVPFGKADAESFDENFKKHLADRRKADAGISLGGFLRHMQGVDSEAADEVMKEQLAELSLVDSLPVIPFDRSVFSRPSAEWTEKMAEQLAAAIEGLPNAVFVRDAGELNDSALTHPNASRRILFLWRNRAAYDVQIQRAGGR